MRSTEASRSALDLLEQSLQLLREISLENWLPYLAGAVPFLLALLFFVRDMATGYSAERCLAESLVCTLFFFWSAHHKARFAGNLARTLRVEDRARPHSTFRQCAYTQLVLQSLKLLVLPLALASLFPLAWTSALFRSAAIEADEPGATPRIVIRRAARHAAAFPRSTWAALLLLAATGVVVFANIFLAVLLLPQLTKIFTGFENEWTRNAAHLLSFNLFATAVVITWFLLDPLMQSYFVVRAFYNDARRDGRDLLTRLRVSRSRQIAATIIVCFAFGTFGAPARAASTSTSSPALSTHELDTAVARALTSREFEWQRAQKAPASNNAALARIAHDMDEAIAHLRSWASAVGNALRRLFQTSPISENNKPAKSHAMGLAWWMISLAALILLAVIFALVRARRPRQQTLRAEQSASAPVDMASDDLVATDMPDAEWLRMARECLSRGDLRRAVRAMYLSNLAFLGAGQWIAVQKSKSNGIYERELRLRARGGGLVGAFAGANRIYERVWYGLHDVTPEVIESFERQMEVIRQHGRA